MSALPLRAADAGSSRAVGNFFYASEWLLILALVAIVLAGAGRLSADAVLGRRR
ncbi:hypothetical protein [Nocardia brasiliensis]